MELIILFSQLTGYIILKMGVTSKVIEKCILHQTY